MNIKDRQHGKLESPVDPPDIATSSIDEVKQLKDQLYEMQMKIVRVDGMEYALAYGEFHNLESQALPPTKEQKKTSETAISEESKDTCVGISFLSYLFLYLLF